MENKNPPVVSIVCLVFNHEKYLRKTFESFIAQKTSFPIEIIVHDDASTDKSKLIIEEYQNKYPDKFKPIYQEHNQHSIEVGRVTKIAFKAASGKYIALCEGDDYWTDSHKLQKQVSFLESNPDYVLTHHDALIIDQNDKIIAESKLPSSCQKDFSPIELKRGAFLLNLTLCFRNVIKEFPPEIHKIRNGDTFLISLLGEYGKAKFLKNIKPAAYRVHSGGVWSKANQEKKLKMRLSLFSTLKDYYSRDKPLSSFFKAKEKGVMRQLIFLKIKNGNRKELNILIEKYIEMHSGFFKIEAYLFIVKAYLVQFSRDLKQTVAKY